MDIMIERGHEEEETKKNEKEVIMKCLQDVRGVRVAKGWMGKASGGRGGFSLGLWCGSKRSRMCFGGT